MSAPTLPTADLGAPGTLRHSVASALVRDPSVRQAYLGLGSSSVGIAAAEALAGPRVSLAGSIGATGNGGQTRTVRTGGVGLDLTLKLWDGGQDELAVDAERHKSLSALAAVAKEVDGSTLEADQAHTEVLRYRKRVAAARDHVAAMQRDLTDIRALVAKKASSDAADLPDTVSRVEQSKARLIEAEQLLRHAEVAYNRVVGAMPSALAMPDQIRVSPSVAQEIAVAENHPAFRILSAEIVAARKLAQKVDAERFGRLELEIGPAGLVTSVLRNRIASIGFVGLKGDLPIHDGGEREFRLRRAVSAWQVTQARREDIKGRVEQYVRVAHLGYVAAQAQVEVARRERKAVDEVLSIRKRAFFELGQGDHKSILDAEVQRYAAVAREIDATFAALHAGHRVRAALGLLAETLGVVGKREVVVADTSDPFAEVSSVKKLDGDAQPTAPAEKPADR